MGCKWIQVILFLVIAVFSMFVSGAASKWVIFIAALVLLAHALWCKGCNACWSGHDNKPMPKAKGRKR